MNLRAAYSRNKLIILVVIVCLIMPGVGWAQIQAPIDFALLRVDGKKENLSGMAFDGLYSVRLFKTDNYRPIMDSLYYYLVGIKPDGSCETYYPGTLGNGPMINGLIRFKDNNDTLDLRKLLVGAPYGLEQYILVVSRSPNMFFQYNVTQPRPSNAVKNARWVTIEDLRQRLENSPLSSLGDCMVISKVYETHAEIDRSRFSGGEPPVLFVAGSGSGAAITTPDFTYKVTGTTFHPEGIREVRINGSVVAYDPQTRTFDGTVGLIHGSNSIIVSVVAVNGLTSEQKLQVTQTTSNTNFVIGITWFVGIGINRYTDPSFSDLKNARGDMEAIADVMINDFGISKMNLILLRDEQASAKNIFDTLRYLSRKLLDNDNVIVYYSGHGVFDASTNQGYWIPADGKQGNYLSFVSYKSILNDVVKPSRTKHFSLLIDACFSGSLFTHEVSRGVEADEVHPTDYYTKIESYRSREALTSGRLELVSDGGGDHSPFAQGILDYCDEKHPVFSLAELAESVKKTVASKASQLPMYGRLDNVGDGGGEYVFRKK